jgi:hypothetical protein
MTWHSVLSGKEECRKNGAWDLTICQSKERALDQAHALLRYGYIVYAIQAGGKTMIYRLRNSSRRQNYNG